MARGERTEQRRQRLSRPSESDSNGRMPPADLARCFPPIAGPGARALILGSMPGVASLQAGQYYAHPRNAFWPIMGELFDAGLDLPYAKRCARLKRAGLAVWDVLSECRRAGSLDSAFDCETERPNDFAAFFSRHADIQRIYFNGQKAEGAFRRHVLPSLENELPELVESLRLPSTSPAHAGMRFRDKLAAWREIIR